MSGTRATVLDITAERALSDALAEALRSVSSHRRTCLFYSGTGQEPSWPGDTCASCGGQRETLYATGALSDVTAALSRYDAARRAGPPMEL